MGPTARFFFALAFCAGLPAADSTASAPKRELSIRVYNYTTSEPNLLLRAHRQATEVLQKAGIHPRWEQCRTSDAESNKDSSCTQPVGPHLIQLRIHSREMAKRATKRSVEFGYAVPLTDSFGVIAGVYLDRTAELANSLGLDVHVVLGHTMAHEIGHLLLGSNSHARTGIMKPTWGDREIHLAKTGVLRFTEAQAERMQAQVAARLAHLPPVARSCRFGWQTAARETPIPKTPN
jgi:hypothetical protein